ncbi:hypothetical protein [Halobacteriovorax marinus]|nr:hypothetical protein [Halobacteriovorax marinus]
MNTINMNFITDEKEYWITSISNENHIVIFKDKEQAHSYKLSLLLGTISPPWEAPLDYTFIRDHEGKSFYHVKEDREENNEWKEEACCQSGCPGCPWTISQGL